MGFRRLDSEEVDSSRGLARRWDSTAARDGRASQRGPK